MKPPRAEDAWLDAEPGLEQAWRELKVMGRRAQARWPACLLLAALGTALSVVVFWHLPQQYKSRVVLNVLDGRVFDGGRPLSARELEEHLESAVFTRSVFSRLLSEFQPMADAELSDAAFSSVRRRVESEVIQQSLPGREGVRVSSTQLAISFTAEDAEQALAAAGFLASELVASQRGLRQEQNESALDALARARQVIQERHERTLHERSLLTRPSTRVPAQAWSALGQSRLEHTLYELEQQLRALDAERLVLLLGQRSEEHAAGLNFEVLDAGRLDDPPPLSRDEAAWLVAAVAFVALLPVIASCVGFADTRIRDAENLTRLGLTSFGQVPAFVGHELGSWAARRRRQGIG